MDWPLRGTAALSTTPTPRLSLVPAQDTWSILEHAGDGRLLRYDLRSHRVEVLLDGLQFANGVALGPEDAFALIAESGAYRVQRLWLTGPRAGSVEIFADNLPGFPNNVTFNGSDRFWVAIHSPRSAILDALTPHPTLRRLLAFLPQQEQNSGPRVSMALAFDLSGKVRANLSASGASAFGPVTEAREFGDRLYFGSDASACPAWLPLADAL